MPKRKRTASRRSPLLPSWIPPTHPLYLNRTVREEVRREYDPRGIFLNIPYSAHYSNLEIAIIATVTAYGLKPRMARERSRMEVRLLRIFELILKCQFALTDLTYVTRMNMPLERGLLLAFGKETFVTSKKRYGALRTVSDLNFCDIHYHEGGVRRLVVGLSRWIEQNCSSKRLTTNTLLQRYSRLRQLRRYLGDDFDRLRPEEITAVLGVARDEFRMQLPGS